MYKLILAVAIFVVMLFLANQHDDAVYEDYHMVSCWSENGDLDTYEIVIPDEVDLEMYSESFCNSFVRKP